MGHARTRSQKTASHDVTSLVATARVQKKHFAPSHDQKMLALERIVAYLRSLKPSQTYHFLQTCPQGVNVNPKDALNIVKAAKDLLTRVNRQDHKVGRNPSETCAIVIAALQYGLDNDILRVVVIGKSGLLGLTLTNTRQSSHVAAQRRQGTPNYDNRGKGVAA